MTFPIENLQWDLLIVAAIGGVAGLTRGFTGFGAGALAIPLISLVWTPAEAVAVVLMWSMISIVLLTPGAVPHVKWVEVLPLSTAAVLVTPLALQVLVHGDPDALRDLIAVVVLFLAGMQLAGFRYRGPRGALPAATAGALGGLITGFTGMGGLPMALYMLAGPYNVATTRANILMMTAVVATVALITLIASGVITAELAWRAALTAAPHALFVVAGNRLFRYWGETWFARTCLWLLIVVGVVVLVT